MSFNNQHVGEWQFLSSWKALSCWVAPSGVQKFRHSEALTLLIPHDEPTFPGHFINPSPKKHPPVNCLPQLYSIPETRSFGMVTRWPDWVLSGIPLFKTNPEQCLGLDARDTRPSLASPGTVPIGTYLNSKQSRVYFWTFLYLYYMEYNI